MNAGGKFTTEHQVTDIYIDSVPTPYDKFSKKVDACYVVAAVKDVLKVAPKGAGFVTGEDINLVYAPERIIDGMPDFVLNRIYEIMKEKSMTDITHVGLYGLTYKENVDDMRESPTLQLLES